MRHKKPGRPTKYSSQVLETATDYMNRYLEFGDQIPSIAGLATILKVRRETLHAWARDESKAEFSHILEAIKATQEKVLINQGLVGAFNPTIVKLALGKHGYSDRKDTQISGMDGGPVKVLNTSFEELTPQQAEEVYRRFSSGI